MTSKTYLSLCKEGAAIIIDNCQCTLFGGFAPNSETATVMSKNLGDQTILSGSVTRSPKDGSQSLQMMSRPLMTADELKTMPKFHFIVAKTGCNPMKTKLLLFFNWGIKFGEKFAVAKKDIREVHYAGKEDIFSKLFVNESEKSSGQPHSGGGEIEQMQNMVAGNMREAKRRERKEQQSK